MKNMLRVLVVFSVVSTVLYACGPSSEEIRFHEKRDSLALAQRKKAVEDSTRAAEEELKLINDSLQQVENADSLKKMPS